MAEQQRCAIEFYGRLGIGGSETLQLIHQVYGDDAMDELWFSSGGSALETEKRTGLAQHLFHYLHEAYGKRTAARF
jgi:hypothetical protein